jgi:tetratricopeptide (TPR) repeat protein
VRTLENPGPGLPEDFDPGVNPEVRGEETRSDVATQLSQLRKTVRRLIIVSTVLFFLLWSFVAYLLTDRPNYASRLWLAITTASRDADFARARRLAATATKRYPHEYWSHEWLADVEFRANNLKDAALEYQRAYDLLPNQEIKKRLQEIRVRTVSQPSPSASPSASP